MIFLLKYAKHQLETHMYGVYHVWGILRFEQKTCYIFMLNHMPTFAIMYNTTNVWINAINVKNIYKFQYINKLKMSLWWSRSQHFQKQSMVVKSSHLIILLFTEFLPEDVERRICPEGDQLDLLGKHLYLVISCCFINR